MKPLKLLSILLAVSLASKVSSQIDCASPSGVLALTSAPVILNNTDVDDATSPGGPLNVQGQTKIFLNPPSSIPAACMTAVKLYVFYSLSQTEINRLSALSQQSPNNLEEVFQKPHIRATVSATSDPNVKNCVATIPRVGFQPNEIIYYRWAKLIDYPGSADPLVWSSTFSLSVNSIDLFNLKFDVELKMDHLVVRNSPSDLMPLMGEMRFESIKTFGRSNSTRKKLWPLVMINGADRYPAGSHAGKIAAVQIMENLSFNELRNIELRVGGYLGIKDEHIGLVHMDFKMLCEECKENQNEKDPYFNKPVYYRILKFAEFPTTQNAIYSLQNNQKFQPLKFGEDSFFELNWFWERNDYPEDKKQFEWVTFYFRVSVKPHR